MVNGKKSTLSAEEESLLTDLVAKYKTCLLDLKYGATAMASKRKAWEELTKEFNAKSVGKERLVTTLRRKWVTLKSEAKLESKMKLKKKFSRRVRERNLKVKRIYAAFISDLRRTKNLEEFTGNELQRLHVIQNFSRLAEYSKPNSDLQRDRSYTRNGTFKHRQKGSTRHADSVSILRRTAAASKRKITTKRDNSNSPTEKNTNKPHKKNTARIRKKSTSPAAKLQNKYFNDCRHQARTCPNFKLRSKIEPQHCIGEVPLPEAVSLYHNLIISNNLSMIPNVYRDLGLGVRQIKILSVLEKFTKCSYADMFLLLRKMRRNESLVELGRLFYLSELDVSTSLRRTAPLLSLFLSGLIFPPKRDLITQNLPQLFRRDYPAVHAIVTCLNIPISQPPTRPAQLLSWSKQARRHVMRFLIAVTPDGFIQFVSKCVVGSVSNPAVFECSGFLDQLEPGSSVATNLASGRSLAKKDCFLVDIPGIFIKRRPKEFPNYRGGLDAAIGRIFEFSVFSRLDCGILDLINHFVVIACALANAQGPVFGPKSRSYFNQFSPELD